MQFKNEFLNLYLKLVEDTESPKIFHLWAALTGVSACAGRRIFLPFGSDNLYPNIYVLLVGSPAARKSSAMNIITKYVRKSTNVKFAPDDTGGKRQGLIAAISGKEENPDEFTDIAKQLESMVSTEVPGFNMLSNLQLDLKSDKRLFIDPLDRHAMFIAASEFTSFTGHGNVEFLTFLGKVYDGEPYKYRLKGEELLLKDSCVSLIGCTTPTNIANAMPLEAIGQGFTSRVIFVYGGKKAKSIARPKPFNKILIEELSKRLSHIYFELKGEIQETVEAKNFVDNLYERNNSLIDSRFTYYMERRHTHLLKVGMCMAIARGDLTITVDDYNEANILLAMTEKHMPDALGEFGLDKLSKAKQYIIEMLRHADEPVSTAVLWMVMQRDLRQHELASCLTDLVTANKIQQVKVKQPNGDEQIAYIPFENVTPETMEIMDVLKSNEGTQTIQ